MIKFIFTYLFLAIASIGISHGQTEASNNNSNDQAKAKTEASLITQNANILASDTLIEYTGRIDFSNPLAPKFSFSGVSIRANFTGTSITAILNDDMGDNYYNVILNNEVLTTIRVTKGKKEYLLAEGLTDKTHEIELFKRTELSFGKTQFFGFLIDEGKSLAPITQKRDLFIEYIGNSITCGYGNEGENGDDFKAETENHFLTYAAITSRNFNARHMAVSRSGIGIYRNYDGPTTGNDDCMTNLYTNIFLYDDAPKYDFAVQPDLVCINLGTNDFSTSGADSALYVDHYFRLIDTIQSKYTNPEILLLVGSMMSGGALDEIRGHLEYISKTADSKGKGKVSFFEMSAQTGDLGIGVHYHPTVAQHQRMAGELTEHIISLKGWKVEPKIVSAEISNAQNIQVLFNTGLIHENQNYSGFSISNGTNNYTIESATKDKSDTKVINFKIKEHFQVGEAIFIKYEPGTVESIGNIKLEKVEEFKANNSLTSTELDEGNTDSEGMYVKLKFNKPIHPDCTIDGLSLMSDNGSITIDSFSIASKYLTCYVTPTIQATEEVSASYNGDKIYGKTDNVILEGFEDVLIQNKSEITSVENNKNNTLFRIWPNPNTTGYIQYSISNTTWGDYIVFCQNGSIISQGNLDRLNGQIDLGPNATEGIYYISFQSADEVSTQKILILN